MSLIVVRVMAWYDMGQTEKRKKEKSSCSISARRLKGRRATHVFRIMGRDTEQPVKRHLELVVTEAAQ